jgi:hypothetical protein
MKDGPELDLYEMLSGDGLRTFLKSIAIAGMVWFGIAVFSASIMKGFWIGLACMFLALFTTWRRFLEPLSFSLFCIAVVFWCDPQALQRVVAAFRSISPG